MTAVLDRPKGHRLPYVPQEDPGRKSAVRKFRPDIEGLRAIAVISVVLSHVGLLGFSGGYVGVDVFFVISGYLITRQLYGELDRRNKLSFRGFYARRARRILPAATLVIIVTLLAVYRYGPPLRRRSIALDGLFSAFSGVNWRLASVKTNYFNASVAPSPFQHYWSLSVEEQFYVVWPVLMLVIGIYAGRRFGRKLALLWTLIAIMAASLALSSVTTHGAASWAYFGTPTRMWELAMGAFLAITTSMWTRMRPALACQMSWLGIVMIALAIFTYDANTRYPGSAVILPVLGSAFVIAGGCPGWYKGAELWLRQRPMQFAGQISYSWYLWHWPLLMVLPMYLGHGLNYGEKWFVVVGSFGLSVATYYLVEQPFRTQSFLAKSPFRSLSSGGILVTTSVIVAFVIITNSVAATPIKHIKQDTVAVAQTTLQKDIDAGAALTVLPKNLTPSLAQAAHDNPNGHSCFTGFVQENLAPLAACTFGDLTATRTIFLVGDSHANSWFAVVSEYATRNHFKLYFYAKANCDVGVYLNQVVATVSGAYTACDVWRNKVFAFAHQQKPTYVLMASAVRHVSVDPSGEVQAVQHFQTDGSKVIYEEDTPNPRAIGSVPDCLAKNTNSVQKCDITLPPSEIDVYARSEANSAVVAAGAHLIDPTPWYCNAKVCPAVINDIVVYEDESHTTETYTGWVAPEWDLAFTQAITTF